MKAGADAAIESTIQKLMEQEKAKTALPAAHA